MEQFVLLLSLVVLILSIIMIVKFFQIASDVRAIKNNLTPVKSEELHQESNELNTLASNNGSQFKENSSFNENDLVVNVNTGKQMRVKGVTPEGKFSCYTNGGSTFEGNFTAAELKLFA